VKIALFCLALLPFWLNEINQPLMIWHPPLASMPDKNPTRNHLTEKPGTLKQRAKKHRVSKNIDDLTDHPLHCEIRVVVWDLNIKRWVDMDTVAYGPFPCPGMEEDE